MFAILGALSLVAGAALLRYAMIANNGPVKTAWTSNWLINGSMAPAVITLFAIGIILLVQFGLDFAAGTEEFVEALVAAAIIAGGVMLWRNWKTETRSAKPAPIHFMSGNAPSPANGPATPHAGTPSGASRGRKKAA